MIWGSSPAICFLGENSKNCRRALYNRYLKKLDLPEPTYIKDCPYVVVGDDGKEVVKKIDYPVMYPHAMFSDLHDHYPQHFQMLLDSGPESFWQRVKPEDPKLHKHPVQDQADWQKRAVPIVIFFDHAPFTKHSSMTLCLWRFLCAPVWGWDSNFLSVAFPKANTAKFKKHGADTWDLILTHLSWSCWHWLWGYWALKDPFGDHWTPKSQNAKRAGDLIAQGKYIGAMWLMACDKEYLCNEFGYPHFNSMVCGDCNCTNPRDAALKALWKTTIMPKEPSMVGASPDFTGEDPHLFSIFLCGRLARQGILTFTSVYV
jgi:hypothetical protein